MALGMKLKQAREAMGLTEADIAESTHMMVQMIQEIEAEDYHRFSAPIYGKGFIKLYAKAVGLDPAPLLAEFMSAMAAAPEKAAKPPQIALEAIDKHNETGISIVTPEAPEKAEEPSESPPPPVPTPRHVYAKASAVTLPSTDSPHPLPEPVRPVHKPVPAPAPVAAPAPTSVESAALPSAPPSGDGFRLEAEPALSVAPPKPVTAPVRPFQHPMTKQTSHAAPAPARASEPVREDDDDDEDSFVARPRRQAPRRNRQQTSLGLAEAFRNWMDKVHESIAAQRGKSDSDDDDSPLGDEAPGRRRRWIVIVAAVVVVALAALMLSSGGRDEPDGASSDAPGIVEGGVEPIVDGVETVSETPVASTPTPAIPTTPTEIVRVLPPPKCFAR